MQNTLSLCRLTWHRLADRVTAGSSKLLPSQQLPSPQCTFQGRTLGLTHPAGRRSLGREGAGFPPGHRLARTPNQQHKAALTSPLWFRQTRKLFITGQKHPSEPAGTLLHKCWFANREFNEGITELFPGTGESMASKLEQKG